MGDVSVNSAFTGGKNIVVVSLTPTPGQSQALR
jgi:hypothetical protein